MPSRPDVSRERLVALLAPVVSAGGLDLDDVEVRPAGRRLLVRVVVDADGGGGLDAVAAVSSAVGERLEESDVFGQTSYVLEVTSPGVDRPLTEPRHWRRARGRLVTVTPHHGREFTGRLMSSHDSGAVLDVGRTDQQIAYADVARAVVQVEFSRTDDPGADGAADEAAGEAGPGTDDQEV